MTEERSRQLVGGIGIYGAEGGNLMVQRVEKIRVAIVGVGNCASSLIQGLSYYRTRPRSAVGLMSEMVGHYSAADIEIVAPNLAASMLPVSR